MCNIRALEYLDCKIGSRGALRLFDGLDRDGTGFIVILDLVDRVYPPNNSYDRKEGRSIRNERKPTSDAQSSRSTQEPSRRKISHSFFQQRPDLLQEVKTQLVKNINDNLK
jgi:hypothetical protein